MATGSDDDLAWERLRSECAALFRSLSPPLAYPRCKESGRDEVLTLRNLLARTVALGGGGKGGHPLGSTLKEALEAHLAALDHAEANDPTQAAAAWRRARSLEASAIHVQRWANDRMPVPAYDPKTGRSRYDPKADRIEVKLKCPHPACGRIGRFDVRRSAQLQAQHCGGCQQGFLVELGEVASWNVRKRGSYERRYHFELTGPDGATRAIKLFDYSGAEFSVLSGDLLGVLYDPAKSPLGILDLSSSRYLSLKDQGPCFVASAAFGSGAAELRAFRDFRDRALAGSWIGRCGIRGYYAVSPTLSRVIVRSPKLRRLAQVALGKIHQRLVERTAGG